MKKIYDYHSDTGEYLGTRNAQKHPIRDGEFILPAAATFDEPPSASENACPTFVDGKWIVVPDWRGHTYWLADRSEHKIAELGVEPPEDALNERPPTPLDALKQAACARIDSTAEATRALFLTLGSGQAMTYQAKEAEARALLQDQNPDPNTYPMLAAMIGLDGETLEDVGETIRTRADAWSLIGAEIERIRQSAKQAAKAAASQQELENILDGLTWPNNGEASQ